MSKATILHTVASIGWGGQEIRIVREMLGMRARGYRVLLAAPPQALICGRAAEAGLETLHSPMDRRRFLGCVADLRRIIRQYNVDLVNTHSSADSWMGSIAGRLEGIAVLRTRHISSSVNGNPLTRWLYGHLCDEVVTTGEFIRTQLIRDLKLSPQRVRSIPTGIDCRAFLRGDGHRVRGELGIGPADSVVGIAAVLRSWKGHLDLLEAMVSVRMAVPDARLVVVGDGPMRAAIASRVEELGLGSCTHMTGHRDDIADVIASFDVAVMASYASEGIPQFALQAMAAGKPVVATQVGGIPEVVHDGVTGLLVPPRTPELLARAVVSLLKDPGRRERLGMQGRQWVTEHHSFEGMLDQLEACYRRLL